ncbi:MAG: fimbria/pilus periplasmic chaperone [Alphaproteobacteria bacterium]|nr:fimbria/pilus periplasmic chaperone [Alphaproteobacteria bacterium]
MIKNIYFIFKINLLILLTNLFISSSWAASIGISPMLLNLSQEKKTTVLTVKNASDEPVVLQMSVKEWQQKNEEDLYTPTKDIIIAPPLVKIGPQERQVVRLSARKGEIPDQEVAYRVFLDEIPQSPATQKTGVQTVLSISLPLFIKPKAPQNSQPIWSVSRVGQNKIKVTLLNEGNTHLKVTKIRLQGKKGAPPLVEQDVLDYILPSKTKGWTFALPASFKSSEILVSVDTKQGELSETLHLPPS